MLLKHERSMKCVARDNITIQAVRAEESYLISDDIYDPIRHTRQAELYVLLDANAVKWIEFHSSGVPFPPGITKIVRSTMKLIASVDSLAMSSSVTRLRKSCRRGRSFEDTGNRYPRGRFLSSSNALCSLCKPFIRLRSTVGIYYS